MHVVCLLLPELERRGFLGYAEAAKENKLGSRRGVEHFQVGSRYSNPSQRNLSRSYFCVMCVSTCVLLYNFARTASAVET